MDSDAVAESGENPVSKLPDLAWSWRMSRLTWDGTGRDGTGRPNLSLETKFSGAIEDREKNKFPVQLNTSRISNLSQLIHALI